MHTAVADGVEWVGVVDWGLRHFHGHELSTHRGSTYNSYLIRDEKTVLVDTVWGPFAHDFMEGLRAVVDPAKIDVVVINHGETDHSGALPALMREAVNATVVCSRRAAESIPGHYHRDWPTKVVGTGDRMSIGRRELVFIEAPMLHWPDTMFTYLTGSNVLMSTDAFGQHYANAFRFNDQVDKEELYQEALKYYVNIINPYSKQVLRKIEELEGINLPISVIAPSHGVIWRDNPMQIVETYKHWARQEPEPRAVILYDSMWQGTARMADAIGEGLAHEGVACRVLHMAVTDRNDALVEVFRARAVVVGSPTLNNGLLPTILPILVDLKGLRFQNKIGAAFGSYGWSGEGVKLIEEHFAACNIPLAAEGIKAKWQPAEDDLNRCRAFGREIARAIKNPDRPRP